MGDRPWRVSPPVPGLELSKYVVMWYCSAMICSAITCCGVPVASCFLMALLVRRISASLCVRSSSHLEQCGDARVQGYVVGGHEDSA